MPIGHPHDPDDDSPAIGRPDGRSLRGGPQAPAMSYSQIGAVLGCSRTLVQAIERTALEKARRLLTERGYAAEELLQWQQVDAPDCAVLPPSGD